MAAYRTKIVALVTAVALGSTAFGGSADISCGMLGTLGVPTQMGASRLEGQDSRFESFSLSANDPNAPADRGGKAGSRELFFKMMVSVLCVAGFGVVAVYGSRKLVGKITNLPGKRIRVVETVHLGPRKAVHLLKADDRHILIGSTNESISKLAELTGATQNAEDASESDASEDSSGFADALKTRVERNEALAGMRNGIFR